MSGGWCYRCGQPGVAGLTHACSPGTANNAHDPRTDPLSLDYALTLATMYIDDVIAAQVALGYDAPPARVRATAIRHVEKAIRPLLALRAGVA